MKHSRAPQRTAPLGTGRSKGPRQQLVCSVLAGFATCCYCCCFSRSQGALKVLPLWPGVDSRGWATHRYESRAVFVRTHTKRSVLTAAARPPASPRSSRRQATTAAPQPRSAARCPPPHLPGTTRRVANLCIATADAINRKRPKGVEGGGRGGAAFWGARLRAGGVFCARRDTCIHGFSWKVAVCGTFHAVWESCAFRSVREQRASSPFFSEMDRPWALRRLL